MAFRAICVAFLLSSLPIAGCGTIANLARAGTEGGKIPFGGVKQDVGSIKTGEFGYRTPPKSDSVQHPHVALMLLWATDLPFSFIGDVVTWPYTATYCYINQPIPIPPVIQAPPGTPAPAATPASPGTPAPSLIPAPAVTPAPAATKATTESRPQTSP
jgi:uncharacterized protein YceK